MTKLTKYERKVQMEHLLINKLIVAGCTVIMKPRNEYGPATPWYGGKIISTKPYVEMKDGTWDLWGCIRSTAVGRVLYHWESESLSQKYWKQTGEVIRSNVSFGESLLGDGYSDLGRDEIIYSPFIVYENELYYMFYGGGST